MHVFKNKFNRRLVIGAALGLGLTLLGGGGVWLATAPDRAPAAVAATAPAGTRVATAFAAPAASAQAPMPPPVTDSPARPSAAELAAMEQAAAEQIKQIEAQWCTSGLQTHLQSVASIEQSYGSDARGRAEATLRLPAQRAQYAVRDRLLQQWAQRLQSQGDARSRATAAYLMLAKRRNWESEWGQALAWMQAEALRSTDPYVLHLWAKDPGHCQSDPKCTPAPLARGVEIEPSNLRAWLRAIPQGAPPTEAQWQGLAQASYARRYEPEFQSRLLALAAPLPQGLELQVALQFIWLESERGDAELVTLDRVCRAPEAMRKRKAVCLHAADLMWRQELANYSDRTLPLMLASHLGATEDEPWAGRFRALIAIGPDGIPAVSSADTGIRSANTCAQLLTERTRVTDLAQRGVWRATLGDAAEATLR
jgi:hypothetical protein